MCSEILSTSSHKQGKRRIVQTESTVSTSHCIKEPSKCIELHRWIPVFKFTEQPVVHPCIHTCSPENDYDIAQLPSIHPPTSRQNIIPNNIVIQPIPAIRTTLLYNLYISGVSNPSGSLERWWVTWLQPHVTFGPLYDKRETENAENSS